MPCRVKDRFFVAHIMLRRTIKETFASLGGSAGAQLQAVLSSPTVTAALSLPVDIATTVLQQHINAALNVTSRLKVNKLNRV